MRKLLYIAVLLALASCRGDEDTRFFAPEAGFGNASYTVASSGGEAVLDVVLSRPAPRPFTLEVAVSGSLTEGVQYKLDSHSAEVAAGAAGATFRVQLFDDEIWDELSWLDFMIVPGTLYTVVPEDRSTARLNVTKSITLPVLSLEAPSETVETNPYLAETLHFAVSSKKASASSLEVLLKFGSLVPGTDYLINGRAESSVVIPAGELSAGFELNILKKDLSGLDRHESLAIEQRKGVYVVSGDKGTADVHLSDPLVDFSRFLRTAALNGGSGYQVRQAVLGPDGEWYGNTNTDMGASSEGSNYLRNFRNMFQHPSFGCLANASNSQMFRLSELFPNYLYPNPVAILDYGNDQGHREFTPADSLMRFVLDRGESAKGAIYLEKPRTFTACIGSYAAWQADVTGGKAWVVDSKANGGDILSSTNPAITGRISVTLHRLEGRFDFTDSDCPVRLRAWLSSDSDKFLEGIDESKFAVTSEDGLYRLEYKLWPR
ncbi:MAG: hypothetical protein IJS66_03660 [Bacteroidales bacterium]|nr:hypothetical protein [Bacteroidales bacterium]